MNFDEKTKKIVCLVVAVSLMVPIALSIISMFVQG